MTVIHGSYRRIRGFCVQNASKDGVSMDSDTLFRVNREKGGQAFGDAGHPGTT